MAPRAAGQRGRGPIVVLQSEPTATTSQLDPNDTYAAVPEERLGRAQATCIVAALLLVAGVLILIGAVFVSAEDVRQTKIDTYSDAIRAYGNGDSVAVRLWSGTVNNFTLLPVALPLRATVGDVPSTVSYSVTARVPAASSYAVQVGNGPQVAVTQYPAESTSTADAWCDATACATSACGRTTGCTAAQLRTACATLHGPNATYSGVAVCTFDSYCGRCTFPTYLLSVCVVVKSVGASATAWEHDSSYLSCAWPFTSPVYNVTRPSAVTVDIRTSTDPYLALQRVTEGTLSFGEKDETTFIVGVVLLVLGPLAFLAAIAAAYRYCFKRYGDEDDRDDEICPCPRLADSEEDEG